MIQPVFPNDESEDKKKPRHDDGYVFQHRKGRTIQPLNKGLIPPSPAQRHHHEDTAKPIHHQPHHKPAPVISHHNPAQQPAHQEPKPIPDQGAAAIELIRRKVHSLYEDEPSAREEIALVKKPTVEHRSRHQQFMQELSTSGKPLAQIQTEWHKYYLALPDEEKHEVWREFYQNNSRQPSSYTSYVAKQGTAQPQPAHTPEHAHKEPNKPKAVVAEHTPPAMPHSSRRTTERLRKQISNKVQMSASTQEKAKQHLHSLVFGLGTGFVVLAVLLFSFFNEMVIAPFIQPSRHVGATPIIMGSDSVAASETPEVIIPKINVQIPVVYDEPSIEEAAVQRALERGVIHYATTVLPGQQGNAALFGHSSNNLFNKGKYKFAFVLLHELVPGDIFYLTHGKKVYTYRVFDKKVVAPSEVSVLNSIPGKPATATLITCDPPGTSTNRLVVWGEQISPDPGTAAAPEAPITTPDSTIPTALPSEGPTLWSRLWNSIF